MRHPTFHTSAVGKQSLPSASHEEFHTRGFPRGARGLLASPPSSVRRACIIDPGTVHLDSLSIVRLPKPRPDLLGCLLLAEIAPHRAWSRFWGGQGAMRRYVIGTGTHTFNVQLLNHITTMPGGPSLVARVQVLWSSTGTRRRSIEAAARWVNCEYRDRTARPRVSRDDDSASAPFF